VFVRVDAVKSNDWTKYVELGAEYFWTRVRFPPPPPLWRYTAVQTRRILKGFVEAVKSGIHALPPDRVTGTVFFSFKHVVKRRKVVLLG